MRFSSIAYFTAIIFVPIVSSFRTNIERRMALHTPVLERSIHERAGVTSSEVQIGNIANSQYIANITIGGAKFVVLLDTGSSDLWVTGNVPNSTDTGTSVSVQYANGEAAGDVHVAAVSFADFTVSSQAFILVQNVSSFGTLSSLGINGIAGLGPGYNSEIRNQLGIAKGDTLLDHIFQLNKTSENYITFLLNRYGDPLSTLPGEFTIGEVIPAYENVTSQPQLNVSLVSASLQIDQHWAALLDEIIGPDGQPIRLDSIVDHTPDGELVAVLDTGFTLPQVPRAVSDAIYGRVQGAEYSTKYGWWLIPCAQELNISFVFGGVTFPVHPLDTSSSEFGATFSDGSTACVGMFQPISTSFSLNGAFDLIMGEAFLRNSYSKYNWGDFVDDTSNARGSPYIQLLPTTNQVSAHHDFVAVRLGGVDTTGDPQYKLLSHGQSSPVSPGERVQHLLGFAYRNETSLAVGVGVGLFVLFALVCFFGWRRFRARRASKASRLGGKDGLLPLKSTTSLPDTMNAGGRKGRGAVPMHDMPSYRPNQVYPKAYS